ncbi:MAG: SUMF1/EgtB/PvdO family nonheme iron enzyme, partial [Gammaproteobacteria bacterium]|nr:SUMF1/EgtB/PvdO family nonheme iron enzyme [Gammaproteobacteria bacterium]
MDLYYEISGGQIAGAREYQEDAFSHSYITDLDNKSGEKNAALVIMADGMGGHAAGNIASSLVVSTFNQTFTSDFGSQEPSALLRDALIKSNAALAESIRETPALDGMGCTMVSGSFCKGKVWWASVGDSHIYLIRDRELIKKNEDHSYGGYLDRMKAQGMEVEPEPGLSRNMLMSAMTGEDIAEIDCPVQPLTLLAGDRVIIASDGLDTLGAGTIIQMSAWSPTPKECVDALLKAVEDAAKPRQDNTTVVVVDVADRDAEVAAAPPPAPPAAAAAEPDPDETQPLDQAEIAAAISASKTAVTHREADYEGDDKKGGWLPKLLAAGVAAAVIGGGGYYYLTQMKPDSGPAPKTATVTPVAPASTTPQAPPAPTQVAGTTTPPPEQTAVETPAPAPPAPTPPAPTPPVQTPDVVATMPAEFADTLGSGGAGPSMVVIKPGAFSMGTNASTTGEESPARNVQIGAFAVGKYEVTIADYELFLSATGGKLPKALGSADKREPVVLITWDDALAYTQWLSKQTGKKYRLPSESEWEYIADAGSKGSYWWGFQPEKERAHCFDCGTGLAERRPTRVGRFDPSPFGLFDTAGNVLEWVHDCYHKGYKGAPTNQSVWDGGDCTLRIARG